MGRRMVRLLGALVAVVAIVATIAIGLVIWWHGFAPETTALIVASATLIGALVTQVVNAHIARANQKHTQELEDQRAQAEALRTYLERMGELVSTEKLRTLADPYNAKRILARVQTKTVLRILSPERKRDVLLFLREMRLINKAEVEIDGDTIHPRIVGLAGADLSGADLSRMRLISTLRDQPVSLEGAILKSANLVEADLERADLSYAVMRGAFLRDANLRGTDLIGADLTGAELDGADLSDANLNEAKVAAEQLARCESLTGATLPEGLERELAKH